MTASWEQIPRAYLDDDVLRREREVCFTRRWTYACLLGDVAAHGDWITLEIAGRPLFVQNQDGELRAFDNVCSHRLSALRNAPRGNGPIQCPYHRWTYDATGTLAASPTAPEIAKDPQRRAGLALRSWRLERCGELVFVAMAPSSTLRDDLGVAYPRLEALSRAFDRELWRGQTIVHSNWKILVQNTLEVEHVPSVHPETFGRLMPRPIVIDDVEASAPHVAYCARVIAAAIDTGTRAARFETIRAAAWDRRVARDVAGYLHYLLFPNTTFASTDGRSFGIFRYEPLAVDRTRVEMRLFEARFDGLEAQGRAAIDLDAPTAIAFTEQLAGEDARQCEAVQRGLAALTTPIEETFTPGERAVRAFREHYLDAMRA